MPPRRARSVAPVQRELYTRAEAAAALGMSLDLFEREVQPFVRLVPVGSRLQVPPDELRRFVRERAHFMAAGVES
jgi:hypothetical protein